MKWKLTLLVLLAVVVVLGVVARRRMRAAADFSQPRRVHTFGGTNYVVRLMEVTVGRVDTSCVVIVAARLENPNPFEVVLDRSWFILVDQEKDYFSPATNGPQAAAIRLPAGGAAERETFSFTVPESALAGVLACELGRDYWVLIKERQPFTEPLKNGEFLSFRRRDW